MRRATLTLLCALASLSAAAAGESAVCQRIVNTMNTLAGYASTQCHVAGTVSRTKGMRSMLIVGNVAALKADNHPTAWLTIACIAAGQALNAAPKAQVEELWFTDVAMRAAGQAQFTRASTCQTLQSQVHAGSITMVEMNQRLFANLSAGTIGN